MRLNIIKLNADATLPTYAYEGDAGLDLSSDVDTLVLPRERQIVPTGIAVDIPRGYAGFVHPRSGLAARAGLTVLNAPGTIDAGYLGEIKVILYNASDETALIDKGQRIAQLVIQPVTYAELYLVDDLGHTARGGAGFGSTG